MQTEDKQLIELAAKSIGINAVSKLMPVFGNNNETLEFFQLFDDDKVGTWNPLKDDGDAFRLAVKLAEEYPQFHQIDWNWTNRGIRVFAAGHEGNGNDTYAATRKAITRAAAEIGRNMK